MLNQHHIADLHNLENHHQSKIQANIHYCHHNQQLDHLDIRLVLNNLQGNCNKFHHLYNFHLRIQLDHHQDNYILNNPNYNLPLK